jgi:hypothetical protein
MGYSTVNAFISDVASFYNDTDALTYILPESTKRRILHYTQRTVDEIWYYRPWSFKMLSFAVDPVGVGIAPLPYNFATVGPKGSLYEVDKNVPWREVDYQELIHLRQNGQYKTHRAFCIGIESNAEATSAGEGYPATQLPAGSGKVAILFPDVTEVRLFTLHYESSPPRVGYDNATDLLNYGQPLPLLDGFHNAILLGTIAKLQEGKGDPRPQYRSEYVAAIATAAAQHLPLTSRMQQLPRALPGGMW